MARQQWVSGSYGDIRRDESIVRICAQALTFDENYADAWALMALAQSQLRLWHGRDVDALPAAERALAINPDLAEVHCVKAHLFEEQGKNAEATSEIEIALRLNPDSWEVNREAARLTFRQGRLRDAIPFFEKAAGLMPTDWHNPSMLLCCYQATSNAEGTRKAAKTTVERVEKAIAKDPTNASALASGSAALAVLGEDQRARDWISRALLLEPDNLSMRYNLSCSMAAALGDKEGALKLLGPFLERVNSPTQIRHLEADPDFETVRDDARFHDMLSAAKQRLGIEA